MSPTADRRLLTRVVLRNYKSIAACDVHPAQLCFFVGPNGAGKSNFLDALGFVADALRFSLDHALRSRGGVDDVRRRADGASSSFGIRLDISLPDCLGYYAFTVAAKPLGGYVIEREEFHAHPRGPGGGPSGYRVEMGRVVEYPFSPAPPAAIDRLYLVSASAVGEFRPFYDALSNMGFYDLSPTEIRRFQQRDPGDLLAADGANLVSVLGKLEKRSPEMNRRIGEYLAKVVPGLSVAAKDVGPTDVLEFRQDVGGGGARPWLFLAHSMSDGTLRALGVLAALLQGNGAPMRRLVGIEEPESALHPAAVGVLIDALREASDHAQVLVTSHSPDLLDDEAIPTESILAVVFEEGETRLGPLDEVGRSALHDHLYTAGELLRMHQLHPDPRLSKPEELDLFAGSEPW